MCEERLGILGAAIEPDAPLHSVCRFVDMPKLRILARDDTATEETSPTGAASSSGAHEPGTAQPPRSSTLAQDASSGGVGPAGALATAEGANAARNREQDDIIRAKVAIARLSPPMALPRQQALELRPNLLPILEQCYLAFGELPNCALCLSQHPAFLTRFVASLRLIFVEDGVLPQPWRAYLGMMAASRHRSKEVTLFMASQFLSLGGDGAWLLPGGETKVPASLRNLSKLNAVLAHQPWTLTAIDVAEVAKDTSLGGSGLSVDQMMQAVVVFVTVHGLCTLCAGVSITPETDAALPAAALGLPVELTPAQKVVASEIAVGPDDEAEAEGAAELLETMQETEQPRPDAESGAPSAAAGTAGVDSAAVAAPVPAAPAAACTELGAEATGESATRAADLPPTTAGLPDDDGDGRPETKTFAGLAMLAVEQLLGKKVSADRPNGSSLVRLLAMQEELPSLEDYRALGGSTRVCTKLWRAVAKQCARTAPLPKAVDTTVADGTPWGSVFARLAGSCSLEMRYQPHAATDYKPVPSEAFSFGHDAVAVLSRFYPAIAELLLDEISVAFNLTYRRLGHFRDVNTAPFRHSVWAYVTMLTGVSEEGYDYALTNKIITMEVKAFVRMAVCAPEAVEETMFHDLKQLTNSEKLHTLVLAMEARKQTSLVFACKAIRDHFA